MNNIGLDLTRVLELPPKRRCMATVTRSKPVPIINKTQVPGFKTTMGYPEELPAKKTRLPVVTSALSKTLEHFREKNAISFLDNDYEAAFSKYSKQLNQMWTLIECHPKFRAHFVDTARLLYRDGDRDLLSRHEQYYVAMEAAARHKCFYLFNLYAMEFVVWNPPENKEWLQGIKHASPAMEKLAELNKFLAHRPWLITVDHIQDLYSAGLNTKAKLMHAVLIMCQTHCLAGFVFAFGIRGGAKLPGWGERMYYVDSDYPISSSEDEFDRTTATNLSAVQMLLDKLNSKSEKPEKCSQPLMFTMDCDDSMSTNEDENAVRDSMGARLLSNMSDFVVDEKFRYSQSKGNDNIETHPEPDFTRICYEVARRLDGSGIRKHGSGIRLDGSGIRLDGSGIRMNGSGIRMDGSGIRKNGSGIRMDGSGIRMDGSGIRLDGSGIRMDGSGIRTESGGSSQYEGGSESKINYFLNKTDAQENYSEIGMEDMANICASENARHSHRHYPSPADICMAEEQPAITRPVSSITSSQMDRTIFDSKIYDERLRSLYPEDIGQLLNDRFNDIRGLTYGTLGHFKNVDTREIREAIWYYVQDLYGLRHHNYNYNIIGKYPEILNFVRLVCCRPEVITRKDIVQFLPGLAKSEKVQVILIAIEAKLQAQLYHVMGVVDYFSQLLDPKTAALF